MRTFAISDVHGNKELFRKALKSVGLKKTDQLILLGDLIDRGEDSKGVLDTVMLLLENGFKIELIMGNHEQLFLDAFKSDNNLNQWLLNGGDKTLSSFLTSSIEKIPHTYAELIKSFKFYLNYGKYIFVHAAINMKKDDPFADIQTMLWERDPLKFYNKNWLGDRVLVHGHNPQSEDEIRASINDDQQIICIDNGSYRKSPGMGKICVYHIESNQVHFIK